MNEMGDLLESDFVEILLRLGGVGFAPDADKVLLEWDRAER